MPGQKSFSVETLPAPRTPPVVLSPTMMEGGGTTPLVTLLPRLPPSRQTLRSPGQKAVSASSSDSLFSCEHLLTVEQKAAVMERYRAALDSGRLSLSTIETILQELNLVPPSSFPLKAFLEDRAPGGTRDISRTTPRCLLDLVGRMLRLAEEATSQEMLIKHAYEAMNQLNDSISLESSAALPHPARSTRSHFFSSTKVASATPSQSFDAVGTTTDPMDRILKKYASKGLRPFQAVLSNGDPQLLRTFVRLGGRDDGAGYVTTTVTMTERCEALGMTESEAAEVSRAFDSHRIGEIEYDDFLKILKMDLSKLPLSTSALNKLKRLVVSGNIYPTPSSSNNNKTIPSNTVAPQPSGGESDATNHNNHQAAFSDATSHATEVDDEEGGFPPLQTGRSLYMSMRHGSVTAASFSQFGMIMYDGDSADPVDALLLGEDGTPTDERTFFSRIAAALTQCEQELEALKTHERKARALQNRGRRFSDFSIRGNQSMDSNSKCSTVALTPVAPPTGTPPSTARSLTYSQRHPYRYGQPPERCLFKSVVHSKHRVTMDEFNSLLSKSLSEIRGNCRKQGLHALHSAGPGEGSYQSKAPSRPPQSARVTTSAVHEGTTELKSTSSLSSPRNVLSPRVANQHESASAAVGDMWAKEATLEEERKRELFATGKLSNGSMVQQLMHEQHDVAVGLYGTSVPRVPKRGLPLALSPRGTSSKPSSTISSREEQRTTPLVESVNDSHSTNKSATLCSHDDMSIARPFWEWWMKKAFNKNAA